MREPIVVPDDPESIAICPLCAMLHVWIACLGLSAISYHTALIFDLSAMTMRGVYCLLALAFTVSGLVLLNRRKIRVDANWSALIAVVSCATVVALFVLVASRPDADDAQLFHRALVQLDRLNSPPIVSDQLLDIPNLPQSAVGVIASYELLVALTADVLEIDPVQAYHNVFPAFSSTMWVVVVFLLASEFGLNWKSAVLVVVGAFAFLVLDGGLHRSFGNFGLVRLWHGKVILCTVLVPASLLTTYRFVRRPSSGRWLLVLSCVLACVSLSGSGLFLGPAAVAAAGIAGASTSKWDRSRFAAGVSLVPAVVYPAGILLLMVTRILENHGIFDHYSTWPSKWGQNVGLVLDGPLSWIIVVFVLCAGPIVALGWSKAKPLLIYCAVIVVLFLNPFTGSFWIQHITPGAYWRMVFLLPVPLCFGMALAAAIRPSRRSGIIGIWPRSVLVLALGLFVAADTSTVVTPRPDGAPFWFKKPWALRLAPNPEAFIRRLPPDMDLTSVLPAKELVTPLALLRPDARLYCARPRQTMRRFNILGIPSQGRARVDAQQYATNCSTRFSNRHVASFQIALDSGVTTILMRACDNRRDSAQEKTLHHSGSWRRLFEASGFVAWTRTEDGRHSS